MTIYDHLVVFAFAVLYPAIDLHYSKTFKRRILTNNPRIRIRAYQHGIAWIWVLSILAIASWIYSKRALTDIGLDFSSSWQALTGLILLISALIYIRYVNHTIKNDEDQRSAINSKLKDNSASIYLPRTKRDFVWFMNLSISAGICEELLFRGYLIWYIGEYSTTLVAIVLSSLLFGLAHSYQGWKGIVQSGGTGLVLAVIYVFTGSLWIPIALHIVGDVYSGMLGWLAFDETVSNRTLPN
jgi:membrane protease YdiL (CAAX protease family)